MLVGNPAGEKLDDFKEGCFYMAWEWSGANDGEAIVLLEQHH